MSFANNYITKNRSQFFFDAPLLPEDVSLVVVIPCYNETELSLTIQSLFANDSPGKEVAVVIVVNDSDSSEPEIVIQNIKTRDEIELLKKCAPKWMSLHHVYAEKLPSKQAGVGWARKIGQDWAITHFNRMNNEDGILLSLDADTVVEKNYLVSVFHYFNTNKKTAGATLYFEHNIENTMQPSANTEGIVLYELYMRYYKHALALTGFPGSIYTVGSCMAVKAKAYVAQGGMNRRKAGEDFYFLHKIMQYGEIGEINSTTVAPSSRISNRVPFGTGMAMTNYVNGTNDLKLTFPLTSFQVLQEFFSRIDLFYTLGKSLSLSQLHSNPTFIDFSINTDLLNEIQLLAANCSNGEVFRKRFFHAFDAFKVLKWLNFAVTKNYPKSDLLKEVQKLLSLLKMDSSKLTFDKFGMLSALRSIDKHKKK